MLGRKCPWVTVRNPTDGRPCNGARFRRHGAAFRPTGGTPAGSELHLRDVEFVRKGTTMNDNGTIENTPNAAGPEHTPEKPDLRGRYVKGNFGKAGAQRGRHAEDEEGQYTAGNYGGAGSEGGLPEPLGDKTVGSGRYVKADYGEAGETTGRTAQSETGRYPKGDYGKTGTVHPTRKPGTGAGH